MSPVQSDFFVVEHVDLIVCIITHKGHTTNGRRYEDSDIVNSLASFCSIVLEGKEIVRSMVVEDMAAGPTSRQLGYGVRVGAEAAIHAARKNLKDLPDEHAFMKFDFRKAFNSLRHDRILEAVCDLAPDIYQRVYYTLYHQHFFGEIIPSYHLVI